MTDKQEIELIGDYYLSPLQETDVDASFHSFSKPEVRQYLAGPRKLPYERQDAEVYLKKSVAANSHAAPINWAIRDRSRDGRLIGSIDLRPSSIVPGLEEFLPDPTLDVPYALFGFWLDPEYQRKGIMTRALKALVDVGHKSFGIRHFYGDCFTPNVGSRKTFEKAGFRLAQEIKDGGIKHAPYQVFDVQKFEYIIEE